MENDFEDRKSKSKIHQIGLNKSASIQDYANKHHIIIEIHSIVKAIIGTLCFVKEEGHGKGGLTERIFSLFIFVPQQI